MKKKKKDDAIVEGWDFDTPLYITMTLFQPKIRNRIKFPIPSHWKPADIQFNDIKTYKLCLKVSANWPEIIQLICKLSNSPLSIWIHKVSDWLIPVVSNQVARSHPLSSYLCASPFVFGTQHLLLTILKTGWAAFLPLFLFNQSHTFPPADWFDYPWALLTICI